MTRYIMRVVVVVSVVAASLNCGGSTEPKHGAVPGALSVVLTTPHADDAAILLTVTGPAAPTSVAPAGGLRLFRSGELGTTTHWVLTGDLASGPILTLHVPDVGRAAGYTATIQGAASTTLVLRPATDYVVTVGE